MGSGTCKEKQVDRLALLIVSYVILISTITNLVKNGGELLELRGSGSAIKIMGRGNSNRPGTLGYKTRVMSVLVHVKLTLSQALSIW